MTEKQISIKLAARKMIEIFWNNKNWKIKVRLTQATLAKIYWVKCNAELKYVKFKILFISNSIRQSIKTYIFADILKLTQFIFNSWEIITKIKDKITEIWE